MTQKICESGVKIWEPKLLSHVINGHLLETWGAIEMERDMRFCKCAEQMQGSVIILNV